MKIKLLEMIKWTKLYIECAYRMLYIIIIDVYCKRNAHIIAQK